MLVMYYECLRVGEAVASGSKEHTITIDNICGCISQGYLDSYVLVLHSFKHHYSGDSKLRLKAMTDEYCPVRALRAYLNRRPGIPGVLFINQAGVSVNRSQLVHIIKSLIQILGLNPSNYNSH